MLVTAPASRGSTYLAHMLGPVLVLGLQVSWDDEACCLELVVVGDLHYFCVCLDLLPRLNPGFSWFIMLLFSLLSYYAAICILSDLQNTAPCHFKSRSGLGHQVKSAFVSELQL